MKVEIKVINHRELEIYSKAKAIFLFEDTRDMVCFDENIRGIVSSLKDNKEFQGKKGEIYTLTSIENSEIIKTILVGLGEKEKNSLENIRINTAKLIKAVMDKGIEELDICIEGIDCVSNIDKVKTITEAAIMSTYKFDKYKETKKENSIEKIRIIFGQDHDIIELEEGIQEGILLARGNLIARELVNEPANILTPENLAKQVEEIGKSSGFEVEVFETKEIEKLGMESFLAVGKGSSNPPRLIVMRYLGDNDNKDDILGLVGKGLTFDAGGYCLKTAGGMWTMKCDMGGAAAVIGAMVTISRMRLKKNVIAVVAACENLISGDAYRPGDIINTMAGKTIEILNTDAEGRLTLVDAMTYIIRKENAKKVVDIATLTGAVGGAIGNVASGVLSNNDEFYSQLEKAANNVHERVWRFPDFDEYKEMIKGEYADLRNSTAPLGGGAITAGLFVGEFVEDKPWIHIDIAAMAFNSQNPAKEYHSKGGTGFGARLLYELAKLN